MGLDMRAYAFREGEHFTRSRIDEPFHYWRKHHALLDWCLALAEARGEPSWEEFSGGATLLEAKDLDQLEAAVSNGELPDHFEQDPKEASFWQPYDLAFIAKARELILAGYQVQIE